MSNNYWDKYSRIHDKPCINGEPSSNNSWLYTAMAKKAGVPVDRTALHGCMILCYQFTKSSPGLKSREWLIRSPEKHTPPISRDEILGLASLGLLPRGPLLNWNFAPYRLPKFSAVKLAKQLWELRPRLIDWMFPPTGLPRKTEELFRISHRLLFVIPDRNYFWQNNLDQLYRFAFSVPVQDRYFILKTWDKFQWFNPAHLFYAAVAKLDKLGKPSGIRWLKYGGENNKLAMVEEFPADHDIRRKLGL